MTREVEDSSKTVLSIDGTVGCSFGRLDTSCFVWLTASSSAMRLRRPSISRRMGPAAASTDDASPSCTCS
jgi:hypothetical protein